MHWTCLFEPRPSIKVFVTFQTKYVKNCVILLFYFYFSGKHVQITKRSKRTAFRDSNVNTTRERFFREGNQNILSRKLFSRTYCLRYRKLVWGRSYNKSFADMFLLEIPYCLSIKLKFNCLINLNDLDVSTNARQPVRYSVLFLLP